MTAGLIVMNELEGSRLFRVWRTVVQMLSDRGYSIDARLLDYSELEFEALCPDRTAMTLHVIHHEQRERQLRVLFVDRELIGAVSDGKIRVKTVSPLMKRLGDRPGTQGVFVFADDLTLTPAAAKLMEALNEESPGVVQWFFEEDLVVNIARRDRNLGTHHTLMVQQQQQVPTAVARNLLGRIYEVDRVGRYYGVQHDQVLRIVRRSETGGLAVSYKRGWALVDRADGKNYL